MKALLKEKKLFLFDLDGVFYRGKESRVKIGGTKAITALRDEGRKIYVLTNNSTDTAETVHQRLLEFEIPVRREEVLTSAQLTAEHLLEKYGRLSYFLVGEGGLDFEMRRCGHRRVSGDEAAVVVVGLDRSVTYATLDHAARLVRNGARLVATHDSPLFMFRTGPAMAAGPFVRAIEYAGGKKALVVGKPSPLMFRIALKRAGCRKGEAVMVGDQVDTDIAGASGAGIDAVLVLSGVDRQTRGYPVLARIPTVDDIPSLL